MGTTTVSEILDRVRVTLQDEDLRWSKAEKIRWINDAHRAIVLARPDAGMRTESFTCVADTRQDLPTGLGSQNAYTPVRLRSVIRNLAGSKRSIRHENARVLNDQLPSWHAAASSDAVQFYVHDPAIPLVFYLYPAPKAGHTVEVSYSAIPAVSLSENSTIILDDAWVPAITDYVLYRAYTKDAEYTSNMERAGMHYKAFADALSVSAQAAAGLAPVDDGPNTVNRT